VAPLSLKMNLEAFIAFLVGKKKEEDNKKANKLSNANKLFMRYINKAERKIQKLRRN
jgi:hypothetical protein